MFCHLRFLSLRVEVSGDNTLPGESDVYFLSFWCCCCWASIFLSSSFTFFWRSFTSFCTLSTFFSTSSWPTSTFFLTSCLLTSTFFWRSVTSFLARCFLASTFFFTSCRTSPWSGSSPRIPPRTPQALVQPVSLARPEPSSLLASSSFLVFRSLWLFLLYDSSHTHIRADKDEAAMNSCQRAMLRYPIHPSAWKGDSANFPRTEF